MSTVLVIVSEPVKHCLRSGFSLEPKVYTTLRHIVGFFLKKNVQNLWLYSHSFTLVVNLAASSHKYRHSNRSKFYVEKFTDFLKVTYFFVSVLKYTLEKRMLLVTKYQSKYATKYMNSFKKLIQIISAKFQYKSTQYSSECIC